MNKEKIIIAGGVLFLVCLTVCIDSSGAEVDTGLVRETVTHLLALAGGAALAKR